MTIHYNVTGTERKRLADYIAGFLGSEKKYLGAPSFSYQVGYITVSKDGAITFDNRADSKEIETLLEELEREGFHAEPVADTAPQEPTEEAITEQAGDIDQADCAAEDAQPEAETAPAEMTVADGLTIQMPAASFTPEALANLNSLLAAKGRLIRKSLDVETLPVEVSPDTVSFPWFEGRHLEADEAKASTHLIAALCDMARNQKRITAKEKITENDKYAFRCFLLRLGFIGAEFKDERKILLRNLSGNSAFKSGAKHTAEDLQPEPPNAAAGVAVEGDPALAEALADAMLIEQVNGSFGGESNAVSA